MLDPADRLVLEAASLAKTFADRAVTAESAATWSLAARELRMIVATYGDPPDLEAAEEGREEWSQRV
jgi:hypothetical protein